jgi:glycosyltransferase involved in cell wall biosynthesis
MDVILIPAYEPDKELIKLVDKLTESQFTIVVVDDGSGENYSDIFTAIKDKTHIVTLPHNCGKGAALKAGMKYIKENLPECEHFITCDADGQHRPEDVCRVRDMLHKGNNFVLTVRQRKGKIPLRSRVGNDLSKIVYTLLTNRYLSDNQSGLRGFASSNLDWLIKVEKNNYDYEMNVLYYAAKMGLKISTLTIDAIYIENNASSHFNPIGDTIKIYKSLFKLAMGTLLAFLLAEILIIVADIFVSNKYIPIIVPSVGAISLLLGIILNKYVFLKHIHNREYFTTIAYTIIGYFVYTLLCILLGLIFPNIPLVLNFNLVYFLCMPLRYFLHQLIFIASLTKE